ncbi:MAG: hypothetical protein M1429_03090 [Patescibacteria group bacterium]|nr:hypothetical protein [Patescibacteria group bacterium]
MSKRNKTDYSDTGRRARAIVRQERVLVDEQFYDSKKNEFLSARGEMLMSIVLQGKILAELRDRSTGFLTRIAAETEDSAYRLGVLADFWQYFRGELPREDVNPAYYLALSRAIRLIQASWPQIDEVTVAAAETAKELIGDVSREISPTRLAENLRQRFGILESGNHPFNGLYDDFPESLEELRQYAGQHFDEVVQPYFIEFAQRLRKKPVLPSVEVKEELVSSTMIYLTVKATGELTGERLEQVIGAIYEALENSGVEFEVKRADAYPQK